MKRIWELNKIIEQFILSAGDLDLLPNKNCLTSPGFRCDDNGHSCDHGYFRGFGPKWFSHLLGKLGNTISEDLR
jgi:hypothetical protein